MINNRLLGSEFYARIRLLFKLNGWSITQMAMQIGMTPSGLATALKKNTVQYKHWLQIMDILDCIPGTGIYAQLIDLDVDNLQNEGNDSNAVYEAQKKKTAALEKKNRELAAKLVRMQREIDGKTEK